jgi:hypothetical protein
MGFLIGIVFGILVWVYVPKLAKKLFEKTRKEFEVTFTLLYFIHPIETSKKGEFHRMKPITIKVLATDEEEAVNFTKEIVHDNIKIEIDAIEESSDGQEITNNTK